MLADRLCHPDAIAEIEIEERLVELGYTSSAQAIAVARIQMSRARAAARGRASQFLDPLVQNTEDQAAAMLALPFDAATVVYVDEVPKPVVTPSSTLSPPASIFMARDERRFSEIIDDVVATMRHEGQWSGDAGQQRRIMGTFAWITENKRLCDYDHLDVDVFRRGLERLPVTFRFGSKEKGAMSRPFMEVIAELPSVTKQTKRTTKTTNRDLSTMSTVAKHLAKTAWRPAIPNTMVLDFAEATVKASRRNEETDTRPPWTRAHLAVLFSSPIYTGGGGHLSRLRHVDEPKVYQDAAYFAPLLWYYSHACREEICGLRVDEVDIDHAIPHFKIQDNDLRGLDGELAGEKRVARKRALPLHDELLRLGFASYVRAIRAEGHIALFPELYLNAAKRGGGQFYNVAWCQMVDHIAAQIDLPKAENGKGPDIHSIRALGSSFYEVEGVNEIMRADVMGHARTNTNAKHYSKRMSTEGLEVVLSERKTFMTRYIPVITDHLVSTEISLLPLEHRSRLGRGTARKGRSDHGGHRVRRNTG
jgi:integrase